MTEPEPTDQGEHTDTGFVPLRVDPELAGAHVTVERDGRNRPLTARVDNDGYLRTTTMQALISRDQGEILTDLDTVTVPDVTYHGFKHGWDDGDAPITS